MHRTPAAPARFCALFLGAVLGWSTPAAWAGPRAPQAAGAAVGPVGEPWQDVGESPERYAQVKVVEGKVTLRKGETDATMTRGIPVAEGDVVESQGRGVLQLGDGSALAFGPGTRFKVAALFSEADQVRRVLLILDRGELRVRKGAQSDALLRVDTPVGTGLLGSRGSSTSLPDATFRVTPDAKGGQVIFMVHGGQASFGNDRGQAQVFAGQRLTVYGAGDGLDRIADFNAYAVDDFDTWAEDLVKPHPSESAGRVPPEIRYYAEDLDANGSWVYVDDCSSWCWTPTGMAGDWRPYCDGSWGAFDGGLTWISAEPWGFLTCHYGRWGWGMDLGWYWIPGICYSPAWVAWNCTGPCFGWAPLGYWNRPCRWGYGPWAGGYAWNVVNVNFAGARDLRGRLSSDPGVFHAFNASGASLRPWTQGRLMVTAAEFRDPARFQAVAAQPALSQSRVAVYARTAQAATGRTLHQPQPGLQGRGALAFSALEHPESEADRPLLRPKAPFQSPSQPQRPFPWGQAHGARATVAEAGTRGGATSPDSPEARSRDARERARPRTANDERPREDAEPVQEETRPSRPEKRDSPARQGAPREGAHAAPKAASRPAPREAPPKDHK